jgi:hypothetical protein
MRNTTQGATAMNRIIFIGGGTDAGGWYIGADGKIHRIPGWNPEQMVDLSHALGALREISQIKANGISERLTAGVLDMVKKELGGHVKEGDVLVVGH